MIRRLAALGAYAVLLFLTAPAWPDDWDGVGFVESVGHFDLGKFQPHPPGYPVYVALLRVAAWLVRDPMRACVIVAVASGVVSVAFAWSAARSVVGERGAWAVATLVAVTPLAWRVCSGVGSEAPALACAAACAWGLVSAKRTRWAGAIVLGLGAGLGLGVRLSWAPLFVACLVLAPAGTRARAWAATVASSAAWLAPLVAIVGASRLYALSAAHFSGHAERWGGTALTEPGMVRLEWLARDLFVDGLGAGTDALGLAIGVALILALAVALVAWRRLQWRGWRPALIVVAPYLLWISLGQNLRDQPRHALPLVALLSAALALPAATSRRAFGVVGVLAVLVATRAAFDAHARRTVPPPGVQLLDLARAQASPERLGVFGTSSVRFFETSELAHQAYTAGSLGDVQVRLTRLAALPSRVWVTSEVEGREGMPSLEHVATLCRPPRIDRRAPCIDVYSWKLPYLPAERQGE
ncbi:MAG TPA: glycosyltransferase family 39 protein [Polyangiaceae bacterium]